MWRLLCVLENIYLKVKDEGHRSPCSCPSQLAKNIYFECRYLISMQKYLPCSRTSRSNCCESAAVCCCAHMRGNWVTVSRLHNTICCPLGISTVHLVVEARASCVPITAHPLQTSQQSHYWAHTNSRVSSSTVTVSDLPAHCMQMYFAQYIRTLTLVQTQPVSPCVCGDILMSNSKLSTMQWTRHSRTLTTDAFRPVCGNTTIKLLNIVIVNPNNSMELSFTFHYDTRTK